MSLAQFTLPPQPIYQTVLFNILNYHCWDFANQEQSDVLTFKTVNHSLQNMKQFLLPVYTGPKFLVLHIHVGAVNSGEDHNTHKGSSLTE